MTTIAAVATPPGRGGLGIIRISGPEAAPLSKRLCRRRRAWPPGRFSFCRFYDQDGQIIDAGVVLYFKAPHSYTGEDVIELQAHGSPRLLDELLRRVLALGARVAGPGEFTRRAVENGKMSLEQAEAVAACIDAVTIRAARQAQRHLQGEFGRRIEAWMDCLTTVVAHVEACLDFPEDEIPELMYAQLKDRVREELLQPIQKALATAAFGERLFDGALVAIIGPPNVGKSSLLNRLSGRDRAIVSAEAGTTRDVLEVDFQVHGIPIRILDTAGLRESAQPVEQEGVRRARQAAEQADAVIYVADATRPGTWHAGDTELRVMNKMDLQSSADALPEGWLHVSARTGFGIDRLLSELAKILGESPAAEEGLLVTRRRHEQCLRRACESLERGLLMLGDAAELDLVALEWRQAWGALAEILGIGDLEPILDRIFSEFCIGK